MDWIDSQSIEELPLIDKASSKDYVIVRKDMVFVPATEDYEAHYEYKEQYIPKDNWVIYEKAIYHDKTLDDTDGAITELARMIAGLEETVYGS